MQSLLCLMIGSFVFFAWEGIAWLSHRYIMHGFLWSWHRSHHQARHGNFERNDLFFLLFSFPSVALLSSYPLHENVYLSSMGLGILCYGIFYLIFHDVIVHQRLPWKRRATGYLRRMIRAHHAHHRKHTREGCEAFGFLWAPKKYDGTDDATLPPA